MKTKRDPSIRRLPPAPPAGFSAESTVLTPLLPENQLTAELYKGAYFARDLRGVARRARELLRDNDLIGIFHHVRTCYFADGLRLTGRAAADAALPDWLEEQQLWPIVRRLADDTWREFLLCDNAVAFWQSQPPAGAVFPKVVILDCEAVDYTNELGLEGLKIKFGRANMETIRRLAAAGFDERWQKAYRTGGWLTVDPEQGECFRVLTWEKFGNGLLMPRLRQVLEKLSTRDLLGTADWLGAWESRNITELWNAGHETRYGPDAGGPKNFISAKKQKMMEEALRTKVGGRRVVANFDVKATHAYLEAKFFAEEKYRGVMTHLEAWGGAAVQMAKIGVATQGLMDAFAAEGRKCRALVAEFLEGILNAPEFLGSARPPVRLSVGWNPDSFLSFKLLLEKLRLAHGDGTMSTETARESMNLSHQQEGDRLAAEKLKPERVSPTFEKAQGMSTAKPAGRPASGDEPIPD